MGQTNIHIDPLSTDCVLKNLGLAIEEIKLIRSIDNIVEQVSGGNAKQLESDRHRYLVTELRFLKKRLASLRARAELE
jgi:hypothetical protein